MNVSSQTTAWVDILLVNYNGGSQILETIASIEQYSTPDTYRITVVDNGSSDDSCDQIEQRYPQVQLLRTGANNGFGKGCNIGARHTNAPHIMLLNPDAQLLCNVIEIFQQYLAVPQPGPQPILGGLSVDSQGTPSYAYEHFPTPLTLMLKAFGLGRLLTPSYTRTEPHQVDYVSGSLLLIGREQFQQLHGFDESFFLYFEETDLCLRARKAGWTAVYLPQSHVMHIGSVSTGMRTWKRMPSYWFDSRLWYFTKNHGALYAATATVAHVAGAAVSGLRKLLGNRRDTGPQHLVRDLVSHALRCAWHRRLVGRVSPKPL